MRGIFLIEADDHLIIVAILRKNLPVGFESWAGIFLIEGAII